MMIIEQFLRKFTHHIRQIIWLTYEPERVINVVAEGKKSRKTLILEAKTCVNTASMQVGTAVKN
jgi:hypothetical protein